MYRFKQSKKNTKTNHEIRTLFNNKQTSILVIKLIRLKILKQLKYYKILQNCRLCWIKKILVMKRKEYKIFGHCEKSHKNIIRLIRFVKRF